MRSAEVLWPACQAACATRCSCRLWKPPWYSSAPAIDVHASSCAPPTAARLNRSGLLTQKALRVPNCCLSKSDHLALRWRAQKHPVTKLGAGRQHDQRSSLNEGEREASKYSTSHFCMWKSMHSLPMRCRSKHTKPSWGRQNIQVLGEHGIHCVISVSLWTVACKAT